MKKKIQKNNSITNILQLHLHDELFSIDNKPFSLQQRNVLFDLPPIHHLEHEKRKQEKLTNASIKPTTINNKKTTKNNKNILESFKPNSKLTKLPFPEVFRVPARVKRVRRSLNSVKDEPMFPPSLYKKF